MEFASKFVFNYSDSDEESVSDDEFQNGMCVSDSGSDDDLEEPKSDTVEAATVSPGAPKGKSLGEAIWSRLSRGGGKATKKRLPAKPTSHWRSAHYVSPETRETSERAVHKKRFRRADTNVVSIKFETLIAPSHMHTGDAVYCGKCKAILSHISKLRDKDGNRVWECEFCSEHESVDVDDAEIPAMEDVTYMLEPAPATTASGPSGTDQSLVIFCVDVSGSMCVTTEVPGHVNLRGNQLERLQSWNTLHEDQHLPRERRNVTYISRLQAMQAAVDHQIQELVRDFPHRRAALIAFNNEVSVLGDGTQDPVCIAGDKLRDREVLSKTGSEIQIPKSVQQSRAAISEKIFGLEEGGATALGPALTVAVAMASKCPGSKVIVCTDGMANVGLGSLENQNSETETEAVEDFYSGLGESALASSVSISVVSITGSDCKLAQLGRVAEFTGGQVNIVDPLKLTQEFSTILADRVIATNVVATFLLHKGLYLRNEEGSDSKAVRVVGNVSADTEITFEYGIRRDNKKKQPTTSEPKIADVSGEADAGGEGGASGSSAGGKVAEAPKEYPFQLQIQYTDTEGAKALRVITQSRPVTTQRKLAEKEVNLAVLGTHTAQTSSRLALAGEYTKSRGLALMNQRLAWRKGQDDKSSKAKYKDYFGRIKGLENGVNFMQQKEISTRGTTYSDEDSDVDEVDEKKKKQKRKKKKIQRSAACSDVTYEAMYDMTHGNIDKFLKKE